jgi:hypothetical protein
MPASSTERMDNTGAIPMKTNEAEKYAMKMQKISFLRGLHFSKF